MEQISDVLAFIGGVLITVYATHQAVITVAGRSRDWMETAAGIGGLVFLVGSYLMGAKIPAGSCITACSLQLVGTGLMLLPRIVRITYLSLMDTPSA